MAARCGICLKTTSNKKERLRIVTTEAEAKIQFGYYSLHQTDLNRSLFNTKVHQKCYQKYFDRWYNQSVRNIKSPNVSNDFEHEVVSTSNENKTFDENRSSNDCDIENLDAGNAGEVDCDDNETRGRFCSATTLADRPLIRRHKPVLMDISNVDYSTCSTIGSSGTNEMFSRADLLVQGSNSENNDLDAHASVQNNLDYEYSDVLCEKRMSDHGVLPVEKLRIDCDSNASQDADGYEATATSDLLEGGSSFLNNSQMCSSIDRQTDTTRSRPRSMCQTSTPKVARDQIRVKSRRRRQSEEGVIHSSGTSDRRLIYDSPLHELKAWLSSILRDGRLIPLTDVQERYQQIIKNYNLRAHHIHTDVRCDVLRRQLESQFPDQYHFETVSKRDGTYIALNDISLYSRGAINLSKSSTVDSSCRQQSTSVFSNLSTESRISDCEIIFNAVRLLRNRMKETLHLLETFSEKPETMTELTNDLFADCIPLEIRNFIGLLTLSNRQFNKFKANHGYYGFFDEDLFRSSSKSLKNTAISHDILNARHDHIVSPKHILLANEICKHGRSNELLSIFNRFGHVASYKTIFRIHRKIAKAQMMQSSLPSGLLPDCYLVQVADNFDLNRETLHGEHSYHFLNRIFVQTPENNYTSDVQVDRKNRSSTEGSETHSDCINSNVLASIDNNNQLPNTVVCSFDTMDGTSYGSEQVSASIGDREMDESSLGQNNSNKIMQKIRAADEALRDHSTSFYHDYEPFTDDSLAPHLLAYGFVRSYFNRLGKSNLPLYSGFMAVHLPHVVRPRHKVTYMSPVNQDPNKLETAEACMMDMKQMLIDSGHQNDSVLVVDERIYRLCVQIKDAKWSDFGNIFLYPGDFHMMKCSMIVIWDMLEESGIDTLLGCLYKGATLRAILSVAHFNKSLRAIKLVYTALVILLHNEYIMTLSATVIDEMKEVMDLMPIDLNNIEENRKWYTLVLDYLSKSEWQTGFDQWIKDNCQISLRFRFWIFVIFDLISPLMKLYTSLRTSNFDARNAAICELAELFFATNHRQYARLTARHLSDLRVCPQNMLDHLAKSFAVARSNRNFSSIALDQTIEVTINKMGKGHGGITGRCSTDLIDIWSNSFTFRSLLSSIACELAGVESTFNSIDGHIECSPGRMQGDRIDLQIILEKLSEEKLFTLNTINVTQIFTGKIIHPNIIESICQSRILGAELLKTFIHERLVTCSTPLNKTLHASSLLRIRDNDTYESTKSNSSRRSKKKPAIDLKKIDAEIRRVLLLAQYRSLDLVSVFAHEFSSIPVSLCSLDDTNLLNQQSKSKDTYEFLKEKFPGGFHCTHPPALTQQQALIVDGSSLLHVYPRASSTVFEYSVYLFVEYILPLFIDYSRVDIVFDSSKSQELKAFIHRHADKRTTLPKYDNIPRNAQLQTGRAYQNFVVSNRARFAAAIVECWKEPYVIQKLPLGTVFVVAGPHTTAAKLERDKLPTDIVELESNQVEADSRMILHIDQLVQNGYFNITVKSIDTDVIILCIYYASLCSLEQLFVDATVPKKATKVIDCTHIYNELIDKYGVNPLHLLIVYALSGCDTCSFVRNISKKTFMQTLFEAPVDFTDLEKLTVALTSTNDIAAVERLFVRCFTRSPRRRHQTSSTSSTTASTSINQKDVSLNELRASMAMTALKQNKTAIAASLPPTIDALFHHCLRVCRQVRIWLQAPDAYINSPDFQDNGFELIDGCLRVKWISKLPLPSDRRLSCCGKHKGQCTRCVCVLNQLPCTIFCQCSIDCANRTSSYTSACNPSSTMKVTKLTTDIGRRNSRFPPIMLDYDSSSEEEDTNGSSSLADSRDAAIDEENNSILSPSQSDSEESSSF